MKSTSHMYMLENWGQSMAATVDELVTALKRTDIRDSDALEVLGYMEEAAKGFKYNHKYYLVCGNLNLIAMIVKQQPGISQSQSTEGGPEARAGIVCDTL